MKPAATPIAAQPDLFRPLLRDMKRRVDAELRKMQPQFAAAYSAT
jgi:hypothetical protein